MLVQEIAGDDGGN